MVEENQRELRNRLGEYGYQSLQLSIRKQEEKRQNYSMSFIAAISQHELLASQLIEGTFDSTLFEEFVFQLLNHLRTRSDTCQKPIVLLMDNAVIHHHSAVMETCLRFKATVLFNAQYSPWLNPIEQLFGYIKGQLKYKNRRTK